MNRQILIVILFLKGALSSYSFEVSVESLSEGLFFENSDFTNYSFATYEENRVSSLHNSDDRVWFLFSSLTVTTLLKSGNWALSTQISTRGLWGVKTLSDDEVNTGFSVNRLYLTGTLPFFTITCGRFWHSIGHTLSELFFSSTVDGVEILFQREKLQVTALFYLPGIASYPLDTYFWSSLSPNDEESIDNFRGDTVTIGGGANIVIPPVVLFSYGIRYGANRAGGSDLAEEGQNSLNVSDGDFLYVGGVRVVNYSRRVGGDITFAWSVGRDLQRESEIGYNGFAFVINESFLLELFTIGLSLGWFSPQFAGMKSSFPGGLLLYGYKGYSTSVYANTHHFTNYGKTGAIGSIDKTVSKMFAKVEGVFEKKPFSIKLFSMPLWANEREESYPLYMGNELECSVVYQGKNIEVKTATALFLPSKWYRLRFLEGNPYLPSGTDPFWGISLKLSYTWEYS